MMLQTTAAQLLTALRLFKGVIERRNTIPVLGTVRFQDGKIVGTNLDVELSVALPSLGPMDGGACIDWHSLSALVGCIDADEYLTIGESDALASIGFNGSRYQLPSVPLDDFPSFGAIEGTETKTSNLGFVAAMRRIRFAMSTEETRYYLNGIAILADAEGKPMVAATDGHRLALLPLESAPDSSIGTIIPKHVVSFLAQHRAEPESCTSGNQTKAFRLDFPGMTLSAKLIDGTYPDIFRVMPRQPKPLFTVNRLKMRRAVARLAAFACNRWNGVKISGTGSELTLSCLRSDDIGGTEEIRLDQDAAKPFEAGYNMRYLLSALDELRGDDVTFAAEHDDISGSPILITSNDDDLRIVQMPMRV